jgi:hypothetical protein
MRKYRQVRRGMALILAGCAARCPRGARGLEEGLSPLEAEGLWRGSALGPILTLGGVLYEGNLSRL